jgi:hypothetical protein
LSRWARPGCLVFDDLYKWPEDDSCHWMKVTAVPPVPKYLPGPPEWPQPNKREQQQS